MCLLAVASCAGRRRVHQRARYDPKLPVAARHVHRRAELPAIRTPVLLSPNVPVTCRSPAYFICSKPQFVTSRFPRLAVTSSTAHEQTVGIHVDDPGFF